MQLTGLKTRIETPHIKESLRFYTQYLGLEVLESWGEKGAILGLGSSTQKEAFLEIAYIETLRSYEGISLQFRIDDLSAMVRKLQNQVAFRGPTERPWGSTYLYLEDPSGIQIIVYQGKL